MVALVSNLRGAMNIILLLLILLFWFSPFPPIILVRALTPHDGARRRLSRVLVRLAELWAITSIRVLNKTTGVRWEVHSDATLLRTRSYLLLSNHVSWTDIFAVLHTLVGRIPFPRFFIKQELIWLPMIGQAAWALDFPFMKRYSREFLKKHPEKRGEDLEATRRACDRFRGSPVSIINYAEGTRFTPAKHRAQGSPFRNLLQPRVGGAAFVLSAMGDCLDAVLDITVAYPGEYTSWWDYISGRVDRIVVVIRELPIPSYSSDRDVGTLSRDEFKGWFYRIWSEKDAIITGVHSSAYGSESPGSGDQQP